MTSGAKAAWRLALIVPLPASKKAYLFQASFHAANSDGLTW